MLKYIFGWFKFFFRKNISSLALIDVNTNINKYSSIYSGAHLYKSDIDSFSYIGQNSEIICTNVGKFCSIADNCTIGLPTHSIENISTSMVFTKKINGTGRRWVKDDTFDDYKSVEIGNDVWIGTRAMIMGGVKIGNGAIIGAGAIVTKDIPDYAIAVGVPAKVIKYRFEKNIIDELTKIQWWNMPEIILKNKIKIFQITNFCIEDLEELQ